MCKEQLLQREGRSLLKHRRFLSDREWDEPHITGDEQPENFDEAEADDDMEDDFDGIDGDIPPLQLGPGLIPVQLLTLQDVLNRMHDLQQSMNTFQAALQEVTNLTDAESDASVSGTEDSIADTTADATEGEGRDKSDVGEQQGEDGTENDLASRAEPSRGIVDSALFEHMSDSLNETMPWEEEIWDLRCPRCNGDIYDGCTDQCDRPIEVFEAAQRQDV